MYSAIEAEAFEVVLKFMHFGELTDCETKTTSSTTNGGGSSGSSRGGSLDETDDAVKSEWQSMSVADRLIEVMLQCDKFDVAGGVTACKRRLVKHMDTAVCERVLEWSMPTKHGKPHPFAHLIKPSSRLAAAAHDHVIAPWTVR